MGKVDLVVKDAQIVTPDGTVTGSVYVDGGRIVGISRSGDWAEGHRIIDADGRHLIPGLVDPHGHPGAKYLLEQDFNTETPGAAAGGVTTVGIMHGSGRATREFKEFVTVEDTIVWSKAYPIARDIGESTSMVDFFYIPTINNFDQIAEIPRLAEEFGLCAYKFYANLKTPATTSVGEKWKARISQPGPFDDSLLWAGFEQIGKIGPAGIALVHNENTEVAKVFMDRLKAEGRKDPEAWTEKSPGWVEAEHIMRYSYFARQANCRLYVIHLTSKEGLEACKRSLADGTRVTVETCPHYLNLTCKDKPGVLLKVNPPIRYKEDNEALWRGIQDGVITTIGTDQVITSMHEKTVKGDTSDRTADPKTDIWATGSGFVSWDALLPVMLSEGVHKGRITLEQLVELCCQNTAKTFGLFPRKGAIRVGSDADMVLVDMDKEQLMSTEVMHSYADFTVFEGWKLKGWPEVTILRGKVIYEGGEVTGEHGFGRAIVRDKDRRLLPVE